ncbi:MAG: hypothetical protein ABJF11_19490 [Reichenbachiella sp.]|uniref:hypothetical protein n=1 Tax=Reichenbachiella sp. TaxID=2184521 RepID=UPI0032679445
MKNQDKKTIANRLKGMPESDLDGVIAETSKLIEKGFLPQDVFPKGIINPDTAKIKFVLEPAKHKELIDYINENQNNPFYREFRVFPLGIIVRDLYETHITLERGGWASGG